MYIIYNLYLDNWIRSLIFKKINIKKRNVKFNEKYIMFNIRTYCDNGLCTLR